MKNLTAKTILITGASRGIGQAIALKCAAAGAHVVVTGKTAEPHPKLPGTIFSVAKEVEKAGGKALPIQVDVRDEASVLAMIQKTVSTFGGIDALINNAGSVQLTNTENTPLKRFDLMCNINTRAVFLCTQTALPYLKKSSNPHVINISPPLSLDTKWYKTHLPYTLSKMGMTMCTLGMAAEFQPYGIAVNSVWPKTTIATAAIAMIMGQEGLQKSRHASIVADAIYEILITPSRELTGQTLLDEDFLYSRGVKDFSSYAVTPKTPLMTDLFVDLKK